MFISIKVVLKGFSRTYTEIGSRIVAMEIPLEPIDFHLHKYYILESNLLHGKVPGPV